MSKSIIPISPYCSAVNLLFIIVMISGCSSGPSIIEVDLDPSHEISAPANITKANVGIFYEPNFARYVHKQAFSDSVATINAGQESVKLFNAAIPLAFENTQVAGKLPPYDIPQSDMDGIVEPRLDYINWRMMFDSEEDFFHVEYTFIFYTSKGVPISFWTIVGEGKYLQDQMENVAQKFINGFSSAPETKTFRKYLETKQVGELAYNVDDVYMQAELVEKNDLGLLLKEAGILPIQVTVSNNTQGNIMGRGFDARLIYSDSKRLAPAFPLAVVSAAEYMSAIGATDPAFVGALFGPLAMIPTMSGQHSGRVDERKSQTEYFEKARLKEVTLPKGKTIQGTLYFAVPESAAEMNDATLSLWFVDPTVANGSRKEVKVSNMNYKKLSLEELKQKVKEREALMEANQPEPAPEPDNELE